MEITLFVSLFMVFCAAPKLLGIVWLTIGHLPRGVIGFIVLGYLPQSHEIVEDLKIEHLEHETLTLEKLQEEIHYHLTIQFMTRAKMSKNWMMIYSVVTFVCYFLDAMTFIVMYKMFSEVGNEHTEILMLLATLVYIAIDIYYMLWISNVRTSLPPRIAAIFSDAILGYTQKMRSEMLNMVGKSKKQKLEQGEKMYEKELTDKQ